ncbi:hypothetical protein ABIF38_006656 [Bradyrhizobium japonicum]|jgi:hypothetical protein|uniref:Uncharacterized protein n=1 Tax=Bradyrhizobium elkanii TaxID=29448 RepID=A0A1E3EKP7_BRAEL|nr:MULTISPECIES: hypothetical protein [Bradyrhizobium]MBP1297694.1 hypothetical protein [Bradyrhizobium elkanii]MBP2426735.1 hypothetical protein [Bradyrhizobium elkanii]MCP1731036.1 hypothetical protein [Bradyrhizobium elkanii]MCP1931589.1 hypothetical protein [Bradyrhizobium elkanii]MCP1969927.1 hypothetical protein [Bradyrhizobium elkanii]
MTELEELRYFEHQCLEMAEQSTLPDARRALQILARNYAAAAEIVERRAQSANTALAQLFRCLGL